MRVNLQGRVNHVDLKRHQALLPVFEAVINSFDAIDDAGTSSGKISVTVERDVSQQRSGGGEELGPVVGFVIEDNGVGFTPENMESFETTDSDYKQDRGGKGVGRLTWLKAFDRAEVDSTYLNGKKLARRKFVFQVPDGVASEEELEPEGKQGTSVRLVGLRLLYKEHCPRELDRIAQLLLEHILPRLSVPRCPAVYIRDENQRVSINARYREVAAAAKRTHVSVKDHDFEVATYRIKNSRESTSRIHYCAHGREVTTEGLSALIPDLGKKLVTDDGPTLISCYVSGEPLDKNLNVERTAFTLLPEPISLAPDDLAFSDIRTAAVDELRSHLGPDLELLHEAKVAQIRSFVTKHPRYRHLLGAGRKHLDTIPSGLGDRELDAALHRVNVAMEAKVLQDAQELLSTPLGAQGDPSYERRLQEVSAVVSDIGRSKLAEYVCHRKTVLDLLEHALRRQDDGKYVLEEAVHSLIFPLRASSNDVPQEGQNLWIIDERLAYHEYLASDLPFDQYSIIEVEGRQRGDLVIFGPAFATVDSGPPFGSVFLIEFKRPMRPGQGESENPILQLYNYVQQLRAGKSLDKHGRPVPLTAATPFYGYVIADLTDGVRAHCVAQDLKVTSDNSTYYGFHSNLSVYVEVMSYDKLLSDARKRNKAFFDSLFIAST